jgi:hypothetical protein
MKKLLSLFLVVLLFSCEDRRFIEITGEERCALCVTTYYVNDSYIGYADTLGIVCNKDLEALNGRVERVIEEDQAGYTMISITRCN